MIPYFVLLFVPLLFSTTELRRNSGGALCLKVYKRQADARKSLALPLFFIILLALFVLRSESVGRDLNNYHFIFNVISKQSVSEGLSTWREALFWFINYIVGRFTDNYNVYLAIVALIELLPIAYVYNQDRRHGYLKIVIFVNMSTFIMLFSGIRQSMAISLGLLAYSMLKDRKTKSYFVLSVIASLIHTSGFMVFIFYPLSKIRLKKRQMIYIIPCIMMLFIFNQPIFSLLTRIVSSVYSKYEAVTTSTGAFGSLILFVLFAAFTYIIMDEDKMDEEAYVLRNTLLFAVALQCFAPLHTLAMRMNYYFIILIPLALGKSLTIPKKGYESIARLSEIVMCVFFTVYFIYQIYTAYITGSGLLDVVPYKPFWS